MTAYLFQRVFQMVLAKSSLFLSSSFVIKSSLLLGSACSISEMLCPEYLGLKIRHGRHVCISHELVSAFDKMDDRPNELTQK